MFLKTHDNFIEVWCVEKVRKLGAKYRSFPVKKWSTVKITWITCFKRKQLLLQSLPLNVSYKLVLKDDNTDKSYARAQVLLDNPYIWFQWQPAHNKHQRAAAPSRSVLFSACQQKSTTAPYYRQVPCLSTMHNAADSITVIPLTVLLQQKQAQFCFNRGI